MNIGLATKEVTPDQMCAIRHIEEVNFCRVKARMNIDYPTSDENMQRFEREVKRFLALVLLENGPHVLSEKVDTLWHYFVLHTREYRQFCEQVFGGYLDHVPILTEEKPKFAEGYHRTRNLYTKHFGPPPTDLWSDNDQICWGECKEVQATLNPPVSCVER